MAKKILVTGSEGFIGSHLLENLIKKNYSVKAFVQYNSNNSSGWLEYIDKKILNELEIIYGDIRDYESIYSAINNCNKVIHLAALISVPYSYISPRSFYETNVLGTLNVISAALKQKVLNIVNTSSSEVYGSAQYVPIDEKHPLVGQSPYAASKISAEGVGISFFRSFDAPVTTLRPFNTFGPRQSAKAIIPSIIIQSLKNKNKINLGNLNAKRDFNFVEDISNAFICALESQEAVGEIINIGTGYDLSIKQVLKLVFQILNIEKDLKIDLSRLRPNKSEVNVLNASNKKAKKILKWKPKYHGSIGFKKAMIKTLDWYKIEDNLKLFKENIYNV
jgi:NAD dependent epimerase/dehydratase